MKITSSQPAYVPPQPKPTSRTTGTNPAYRPGDGFDAPVRAPAVNLFPGRPNDPPVFTGFDDAKRAAPLKLQADGQPKSAKYTFAKLAQQSGVMPRSKPEAEAWFNQYIKPGMEAAGFKVDWVKGDTALIHTRENPQGEPVDFLRGAGSNDPGYQALAWQTQDPGGAAAAGGASAAGAPTDFNSLIQQLLQMLQQLMDPNLSDAQRQQGLQQLASKLGAALGTGAPTGTATPSAADKPFTPVPGFDFGKLQDLTHVNDKYTPAVRAFSQAIGGLPPVSSSLPAIVDYAKSHGFPKAQVTGADTIDFGDGHGKIDVITDVGGPRSNWWFNNQP